MNPKGAEGAPKVSPKSIKIQQKIATAKTVEKGGGATTSFGLNLDLFFVKNTPALTWHQFVCKFLACKLSSLGPGAELLPQANEIRPRAGRSPPAERVELGSVCG